MIIFDLDGTLLNTINDLGQACNYTLQLFDLPQHSPEEYKQLVGNGISKLIERSLPAELKTDEMVNRLRPAFIDYYNAHCCEHTFIYDGMKELIDELYENNIDIAVASNKYQQAAEQIVNHYFPNKPNMRIWGQQDNIPTKPNPAIVDIIINQYGADKSKSLFVGDSNVDILTARNAGIKSAGVVWGFRGRSELEQAGADYIIEQPNEIINIYRTITNGI